MRTRVVRVQLVVFSVIAALSIGYLLMGYGEGSRNVGASAYDISADFADTSGLYPRALVTYRGAEVGRVSALDLQHDGVAVRLSIDDGIKIPRGTRAEIHSTSAIGEQYVDLVPERRGAPYLAVGEEIPRRDAVEMQQISPVLDNVNSLLGSVPRGATDRLLDEINEGFSASTGNLEALVDSSASLVDDATQRVGVTSQLIGSLRPVLQTQRDIGRQTEAYVASLASVTGELRKQDPAVRQLLNSGPPAVDSIDGLVGRIDKSFPILIANLISSGEVFNTYLPNIRQTLVLYPALVDRLQGALIPHRSEGMLKLDIETNFNDPPACKEGYIPLDERRDPSDTSQADTATAQHCTLKPSAPQGVRGARNQPCPNDPSRRAASPAGCGLIFPGEQNSAFRATGTRSYAPSTRMFTGPDGTVMKFGGSSDRVPKDWAFLLTGPLK
jgi:phospholipid/cholesterol/gamma-HCH transport system substrate-binding protein